MVIAWLDYTFPLPNPPRGPQLPIKTFECPADTGMANGPDVGYWNWQQYAPYCVNYSGTSYGVNAFAFGSSAPTGSPPIPPQVNLATFSRIPASFSDGTSNTILFTEKLSTCGICTPGPPPSINCGGSMWSATAFSGGQNFLPIVGVVGPGNDNDIWWRTFVKTNVLNVSPLYPSAPLIGVNPSTCSNFSLPSSSHTAVIMAGLGDASVARFLRA